MVKVLVFGTFDGIHEGHRAMLAEAKALGDYLIVAVAPDPIVSELKGCIPRNTSAKRIADVKAERIADEVILGDKLLGNWSVLKKYRPDIIALGYDQEEIKEVLEAHFENSEKKPKIVMLKAHQPEKYKSSLLKRN